MKILRTDRELHFEALDAALRAEGHDLVLLPDGVRERELIDAARDAELILMCYTPLTRAVIAAAPKLRGIVKYGVGIDAIDIRAATEHGVPVVNVPEYAEETVAEGAFALMLALLKKLIPLDRTMQEEGWAWPKPQWCASDVSGKTIALVGFGRIGRSFARMAGPGFRARVLAYDPFVSAEDMAQLGVEKHDDLHEMLGQADVVSLHATLSEGSAHLLGAAEFHAMKPGAILINVARGGLLDEEALLEAVLSGRLGGAGLDVFAQEPLSKEDHPLAPLFGRDNVILSPHLTFYTKEAMARLTEDTLARCREILSGQSVLVASGDPRLAQPELVAAGKVRLVSPS